MINEDEEETMTLTEAIIANKATRVEMLLHEAEDATSLIALCSDRGQTLLEIACEHGNLETAQVLLASKSDANHVNPCNGDGETLLIKALRKGNKLIASSLLEYNADPKIESKLGVNAIN